MMPPPVFPATTFCRAIWYSFGSSTSSISHVGIYVGSNQFIHAPSTGDVVKYSSLTGSYATRYQGAGRVIFW